MKFLYLALLTFSFYSFADNARYSLLDDKLQVSISTDLKLLPEEVVMKRFAKQKLLPYAAFSDDEQTATFTITQFPTPADNKSMKKMRKAISNMLRQSTPKADWKKDKLTSQSGTRFGVYEYEIDGVGKYAYNITYAFPVNGQLTYVTFSTTNKKYKAKWSDIARDAYASITDID